MKLLKVKFFTLMLGSFGSVVSYAQGAVDSSGGNASGVGGTVSYAVGQVLYKSDVGAGGSVNTGIQQLYEIEILSGAEHIGIELSCSIYPNPVSDFLYLKIAGSADFLYAFQLYDASGKILFQQDVTADETSIPMNAYAQGIYFLKIIQKESDGIIPVKSFKIIKK